MMLLRRPGKGISNGLYKLSKFQFSQGTFDSKGQLPLLIKISRPNQVISLIEKGWERGILPMSDEYIKEYIKAVGKVNKIDDLDVKGLLEFAQKRSQGSSNEEFKISDFQSAATLVPGTSPGNPLYIANGNDEGKGQRAKKIFSFLFKLGAFFLIVSIAGKLLDEKGAGGGLGMFKSIVHEAEDSDKTFDDVVGVDEAKADLQELVLYLKDPTKFTRLGGKLPKGILLTGPPGNGKTLIAKAVSGEAKVPFFYTSGSEFEEMYVGLGARRVRELFAAAKEKAPCIIFIDEIDAMGGSRNLKEQSAMKMTLNQLLVQMDGFEENNGVIVIGATNFPDSLDAALLRPGRFDKHIDVPLPDIGGRKKILEFYGRKVPLAQDVDMEQLARGTPGFSGADLSNLVNQAAVKASIDGLKAVSMSTFEFSKDKILMGAERKSAIISMETLRLTAFHEAGHALIAIKTEGADPVHKATIMPRGRALGMVMQLPDGDQTSMSKKQMIARLDVCMGGRAAEELIFGSENVTSGASSDIQQATRLAKAMVTKFGLSEKIGLMYLDDKERYSSETIQMADGEIKKLLSDSYSRSKSVLETNRQQLERIASALLEYESLSGQELVDVMNGRKINLKQRSQKPSREFTENVPLPGAVLKPISPSSKID